MTTSKNLPWLVHCFPPPRLFILYSLSHLGPTLLPLFYKSIYIFLYHIFSSTTSPTTTIKTMEINYRHRNTPSSRRFHNLFTLSTTSTNSSITESSTDELTEADLFSLSSDSTRSPVSRRNSSNLSFKSGILAALSDDSIDGFSTATPVRAIPKPPQQQRVNSEWTQSVPCRKYHQHSAPVNVPMMMKRPKKFGELDEFVENEDEDEEEMLPPHEIVAMKLKSTSSVLEGVGRTLKGRDLRQVRNAVWSKTGFLD